MKFDTPAPINPIDRQTVIGRAHDRIDGPLKTTGTAPYAYERHGALRGVADNQAYGHLLGAGIAKGRIVSMELSAARAAPGVIAIVTTLDHDEPLPKGHGNKTALFGGSEIRHYHQAIAMVVAETFEQARAAAGLIGVEYETVPGAFDLVEIAGDARIADESGKLDDEPFVARVGDFAGAFASAPVQLDATYSTPDESQAMMEPFATIAAWDGDKVTLWTSNQMIGWAHGSIAKMLGLPKEQVRIDSPYIGGGFGAKLYVRAEAIVAALAARKAGRPVRVAMQRPLVMNNGTHRPATIQQVKLGATPDGRLTAFHHSSTSGNLPGGDVEVAVQQSRLLYAAPNREMFMKLAVLDLPEGNSMRAPGEAPGMMVLELAMDELAEKLGMDPVELRIVNDTQTDPEKPERPFSERHLIECLRRGAQEFGWNRRNPAPGQVREGRWLIGLGMAAGFRNNQSTQSAARVRLEQDGTVTVETDMTDIGTGSYTILAQTAAEMLGLELGQVKVVLGDSDFPTSAGSGGQWGANNSTAGVYAACVKLREQVTQRLGFNTDDVDFINGEVRSGGRAVPLVEAARAGALSAEDKIEYGDLAKQYQQSTFAGHFVEVAVDAFTGETRIRRMLAVCDAGRILNPKSARSQVIGAMTMGTGAALMEELAVDTRLGLFINHDLAGYEVPVHADIPHQQVIFLDYPDDKSSPMKAKGVAELGICGVAAAVANAVYNATGVRVRDYPITLDKHLAKLPRVA